MTNNQITNKKNHSGQIALIVLIVSAVVMTIGMSLSKRTVTETKIDTDLELSKSAFDSAESGIDYYVRTGTTLFESSGEGVDKKATVQNEALPSDNTYTFDNRTVEGKGEYFWLVNHNGDGSLGIDYFTGDINICVESGVPVSVKVDYFYYDGADFQVDRSGYNLNYDADPEVDKVAGFDNVVSNCVEQNFSKNSILLVMTPLFNNTKFTLSTLINNFPSQGTRITSTGQTGDLETVPINRNVSVIDRYKIPAFLLEAITSEGDISN